MRVIIAGGTGLIGRALAAQMIVDGHEVIVLSRHPARAAGFITGVRVECWNTKEVNSWAPILNDADVVINLAGENIASGRWTEKRKRRIRESRLNAGRAIVQAINTVTHKPRIVIQSSGIGYYGNRGDIELDEDDPAGNDFLACLATEWEGSITPIREMGIRSVIIRTGIVLSTDGGALPRFILLTRLFMGRLGSGRQWLPWIHIDDEVNAILFLIEHEQASGPFNLIAPAPITVADFSRYLGQKLNRPILVPVPSILLRVFLGEMATSLLGSQRAVPQRLLQSGFYFKFPELKIALDYLLN